MSITQKIAGALGFSKPEDVKLNGPAFTEPLPLTSAFSWAISPASCAWAKVRFTTSVSVPWPPT